MRIAQIGLKGVPAKWGGIELFVQEIGKRLCKRGHEIFVYSRKWYVKEKVEYYDGMRIIITPTIRSTATDAIVHSFISTIDALSRKVDIIHYHSQGSYFSSIIPKIFKKKIVATIHSTDWLNPKWKGLPSLILRTGKNLITKTANAITITAPHISEYIGRNYHITHCGAEIKNEVPPINIYSKYNLEKEKYILFIGRLEPQKRIHWIIQAFNKLLIKYDKLREMKLVIAGGSSDKIEKDYYRRLKEISKDNPKIIFTGYVSGIIKDELLSNASFFVLPSIVEGLPISLLEAMSYSRVCLVSDIAPHKYIISDRENGFLFKYNSFDDFLNKMEEILVSYPAEKLWSIKAKAKTKVEKEFNWEKTVDVLENIYLSLI